MCSTQVGAAKAAEVAGVAGVAGATAAKLLVEVVPPTELELGLEPVAAFAARGNDAAVW